MADSASTHIIVDDDGARRERAKERFYVLSQTLGWGFFWALQSVYVLGFAQGEEARDPVGTVAIITMVAAEGLLLTHYSRRLIARWGWKHLGWRKLGPRLLGLSTVQALVWSVVGYGYSIALCKLTGMPWPSKYGPVLLIVISWINGTSLLAGWHCIYFFYHLFDRFNRSEIERLRLATTVKESELRALKSQVNPHFIFNSLNSLRALIDEDPARARQSVTQLANLLRYSLQSGQLETVPFEDELRVVNDYLALEQVRHEERLRVRLDIAPETLALPIPPMLLQTLVENAVKYGISTQPEGGEIAIIARRENDSLKLQVTNPGALAATADATARARSAASTGVGLKNAANRLRLLFGERATLQLRAESPALVVAEAILPLHLTRA
jgi:signal transduction histidine kinase